MRWEHGRFDQAWMIGPTVRTLCTGNIHAIILWAWMPSTHRNHGRHILIYVVILQAWICSPTVCISNMDVVILRERMLGSALQEAATRNTHTLQAKPTQRVNLHHPHKKPQTSKTRGKHAAQGKLRRCRVRVAGPPGANYCGLPR